MQRAFAAAIGDRGDEGVAAQAGGFGSVDRLSADGNVVTHELCWNNGLRIGRSVGTLGFSRPEDKYA